MKLSNQSLHIRTSLAAWFAGLSVLAAPLSSHAAPSARMLESSPAKAPSASREVVYQWSKTISPDGEVRESTPVHTLLDRLDQPGYAINLDTLEDTQGNRFEMSADAWQSKEDGEVHYEIRLTRYVPRFLSADERASGWAKDFGGDFKTFLAEKQSKATTPAKVEKDLQIWIDDAAADDEVDVVLVFENSPALALPKLGPSAFSDEPALALAQLEDRILTIEERKTEIELIQRPFDETLSRLHAKVTKRYWLFNGLEARVSRKALDELRRDPRIRSLERRVDPVSDVNNLDDMVEGAQISQLHDAGFKGESASGAATVNDIHLAIIDDNVDATHPAWDDWGGGPSRLVDIWREVGGVWTTVTTSGITTPSHGTKVAGIALADLDDGQDSNFSAQADQAARSGFAPEASFSFIESSGGMTDSIQQAVSESVDIINLSISSNYNCNLSHSTNDAVDEAMLAGIFVAKSAGSNGSGVGCDLGTPAAASGAFSVAASSRSAVPVVSGLVTSGSSSGPDAAGRAGVAMVAPAGTEGSTTAMVGSTYGTFGATSAAAPAIAGSAAVLKEHLIDVFSASLINEVGFLYASLMVMGDGETGAGLAGANVPVSATWGFGRMRARLLSSAGMDGPWRFRLFSRTIDDGEIANDLEVNPSGGVNQPLSNDVERVRAAVFWHEPNLEDSTSTHASIASHICRSSGCYGSGTSSDSRQRLRLGNVAGGEAWTIRLQGYDVPASADSNYFSGLEKRKVYVAVYFEDEDRDDADGPSSDIQ